MAGISPAELMGNAADGVVREIRKRYPRAERALVLCGPGNNGGDGYGVASRLLAAGVAVEVLEVVDRPVSPEAAAERAGLIAAVASGDPAPLTVAALIEALSGTRRLDLVVDALFGVGLKRPLADEIAEVVARLNADRNVSVISVDVPSGINADRAEIVGPHVRADLTVQLAGPKLASLCQSARSAYGESVVVDIGIPSELMSEGSRTLLLDPAAIAAWLPERETTAHKYSAGAVCVVAGSSRYLGAAELACRGAWRGGAGLVTLAAPDRLTGAWPETVYLPWTGSAWPPDGLEPRHAGAVVFGPGLEAWAAALLPEVLAWTADRATAGVTASETGTATARATGAVVIDASALDPGVLAAAVDVGVLGPAATAGGPRIITPHAGEAARILGLAPREVEAAPLDAALELSKRFGCVSVLKGATTVIADADGRAALSVHGHPGMAAGGTGDVLAGLLGALLSAVTAVSARGAAPSTRRVQHPDAFETTCAAVVAHGLAGEAAAARLGRSLVASDLVAELPAALNRLAGGRW